jgi:hypothetical protein
MTDFNDAVNISKELKLHCDVSPKTKQKIVESIWGWKDGIWQPMQPGGGLSYGESFLTLKDTTQGNGEKEAQLFLIIQQNDNEIEPLVGTNKGLVVQKDIGAGGILTSNQGALVLGSGFNWQLDTPTIYVTAGSMLSNIAYGNSLPSSGASLPGSHVNGQVFVLTSTNPYQLYESDGAQWKYVGKADGALFKYTGETPNTIRKYNADTNSWETLCLASLYEGKYFDTIYLKKFFDGTSAHLDVGNLTVHGNINVDGSIVSLADHLAGILDSSLHILSGFLGLNPSSTPTLAGLNVDLIRMINGLLVLDNSSTGNGILQYGTGNYQGMRLAQTTNGYDQSHPSVLSLQTYTDAGHTGTFTWQLGVMNMSTLFADHINSASAGGIYLFDDLRLYGPTSGHKLYDSANNAGSDGQYLKNVDGYPQWANAPGTTYTGQAPISVNGTVISIPQANGSTNGYLSSGDWNTFNNKYGSGSSPSFGNLSCGTVNCGNIASTGTLTLSNNTNGYLWNNGGYIRQSGGNGFVADGSISCGQSLTIYGAGLYNANGYQIIQGNASDWLRINQNQSFANGVAAYGNWSFGGVVHIGTWGGNPTLSAGSATSLRVGTDSGYGDIGPQNGGYFHFITDRPQFYFDHSISVNGPIQFYATGAKLYSNASGVIQVQDSNGYLATLDCSNLFVDHIMPASSGGYLYLNPSLLWTNGENDGVGPYYPSGITYSPSLSLYDNWMHFYVSNGSYGAGSLDGRRSLALSLRGDGLVVARAGYMCVQGGDTRSLNLWDGYQNTLAYFAHDGSNAYINCNGTLFLNGSSGLVAPPSTHNVWCGQASTSGYAWAGVAGNYIYSHSSYTGHYDEYDDLAYVKNYKVKKAMINDPVTNEKFERTVIDVPTSFPFLVNEHGFMHVGDTFGYAMGCLKQVALKLDEYDANFAEVAKLKDAIAELQAQLKAIEEKTAA